MNKYRMELVGMHGERIFMGGRRLELSEWARRMNEERDNPTKVKKHRVEQNMNTKNHSVNIEYMLVGVIIGAISGVFIAVCRR